jgi:hypothetical protein
LSNASTHELTLVPAVGGYTFLATDGSGNLFTLTLDINGTVSVSPDGTGGLLAQTRQEYKGHRIELRARVGGLELLIDDEAIRYGQLLDGQYFLYEYAYDWRDNLMDLARRFIDYRDRAEEIRRSRVR